MTENPPKDSPQNAEEVALKEGYLKVIDSKLGESLFQEVADSIRAANGHPEKYETTPLGTEYSRFSIKVEWKIKSGWTSNTYKGKQLQNSYSAESIGDVKSQANDKMNRIVAGEGLLALKKDYKDASPESMLSMYEAVNLSAGATYAYAYNCDYYQCRYGKVPCTMCNGRGGREVADHNSNSSHATRWETCVGCYGNKKVACQDCAGTGVKTYAANVWATATPTFSLQMPTNNWKRPVGQILSDLGPKEVARLLKPKYTKSEQTSQSTIASLFRGVASLTSVEILSPEKNRYLIRGIGKSLTLYKPDAVLDELLKPLQELSYELSKMSRAKKQAAFEKLQEFPALRSMMEMRARFPDGDPQQQFANICNGLVSQRMANDIGQITKTTINSVCPRYSVLPWIVLSIPASLLLLTIRKHQAAIDWPFATLLLGIPIFAISSMITLFRRRKVPKEYRTRLQEWKMLLAFIGLSAGLALYSASLPADDHLKMRRDIQSILSSLKDPALLFQTIPNSESITHEVARVSFPEGTTFFVSSNTNFRAGPNEDASVLSVIPKDSQLNDITGEFGPWYLANYNGNEGFVHKTLVGIIRP